MIADRLADAHLHCGRTTLAAGSLRLHRDHVARGTSPDIMKVVRMCCAEAAVAEAALALCT